MIKKRVVFAALLLLIGAQLHAAADVGVARKNGLGDVFTKDNARSALKWGGIGLGAFAAIWKLVGDNNENAAGWVAAGYTGLYVPMLVDKIVGSKNTLAPAVASGLIGSFLGFDYLKKKRLTTHTVLEVLGSVGLGVGAQQLLYAFGPKICGKEATNKIAKGALTLGIAVLAKKMFNYIFPASDHPLGYDPNTGTCRACSLAMVRT